MPNITALIDSVRLHVWALVIVVISVSIGDVHFTIGHGNIVLLSIVWALLLGAMLGMLQIRLPHFAQIDLAMQHKASVVLQLGVPILVAKLGIIVGGALPKLAEIGWVLVFQEFGHFVGTIVLGLPVALMLGIKREAIGATFSIGREPSLAIIGEKYGFESAEGRGVLAEYLTGTVFGAVFISLLAGFVVSLNLFHPHSLAMGAGVGSISMMVAATGAIAAQQTQAVAESVFALAAASNLLTSIVGTYFTLFISLPLTEWGYKLMEPLLGRTNSGGKRGGNIPSEPSQISKIRIVEGSFRVRLFTWVVLGVFALVGNSAASKETFFAGLPGMLVIVGVVIVGDALYLATRRKVPAVFWITFVAMASTVPTFPSAAVVGHLTGQISLMALSVPVLTYAGLSIAKDMGYLRSLGWRIVAVSLLANAGTFLGASIIAELALRM